MELECPSKHPVGGTLATILIALLLANSALPQPTNSPVSGNPGANPGALPDASVPKILKAQWRSVSPTAPISSIAVEWDGQTLKYELTRPPPAAIQRSDRRVIRPSEAAWKEFAQSLEREEVWKWAGDYPEQPGSTEGRAWSVEIEWGKKAVNSRGTMGYPTPRNVTVPTGGQVMLNRLWYALDRLSAIPIEVEGRYFAGFEASQFRPSADPYAGQVWWLSGNNDFNERYAKLSPSDEIGSRFAGPQVITKVRGRLLGPGEYGHLGGYKYEFLVEEVLEMREAQR